MEMMEKRNVATERRVVDDDLDGVIKEAADAFAVADEIRKEVDDMSKEARQAADELFAAADRAKKAALEQVNPYREADEEADEDTLGLR